MRTPIIILIFGAPKIGKSNIANQLADKMNISNVLQTDIICSVMQMMHVGESTDNNWSDLDIQEDDEIIKRYSQRCYQVRKGANTDIQKCLAQGKPVIIEGSELNPQYYLKRKEGQEDEQYIKSNEIKQKLQQYIEGSIHERDLLDDYSIQQDSSNVNIILLILTKQIQSFIAIKFFMNILNIFMIIIMIQNFQKLNHILLFKHLNIKIELFQPEPQEWEKQSDKNIIQQAREYYQKFNQSQMVVVAFHLVISKKQHRFNINNLQLIQKISEKKEREEFQTIQNHLLDQCSISCTIPIDINCQQHTLDTLQKILLKRIENWYQRNSSTQKQQELKDKQ